MIHFLQQWGSGEISNVHEIRQMAMNSRFPGGDKTCKNQLGEDRIF